MTSKFMPTAASRGHLSQLMALPQRRQGWSRHTGERAGISELIPGTPTAEAARAVPTTVCSETCTQVTGNATGHTSWETTPAEEHTAAPFPVEHASPTDPHATACNWVWGFYSNSWGPDPLPNRAVTSTKQRGGPAQHPGQAVVTTTAATLPSRGQGASTRDGRHGRHP